MYVFVCVNNVNPPETAIHLATYLNGRKSNTLEIQ